MFPIHYHLDRLCNSGTLCTHIHTFSDFAPSRVAGAGSSGEPLMSQKLNLVME